MTKKKQSLLPKFEVLIIFVFFISFILWAMSKCNKTQEELQDNSPQTTSTTDEPESSIPDSLTANLPENNPQNSTAEVQTPPPAEVVQVTTTLPRLYVTIEGLKMRTEPSLNSEVILKLNLFDEVGYLGERTDSTTQVNLGYELVDEYWYKVQHERGKSGWVFGAGVHFHKEKRGGVIE